MTSTEPITGADEPSLTRHRFEVMGTQAEIVLRAEPDVAMPLIEASVVELEAMSAALTRFDSSSELERLNDAGSGEVSADLWDLLVLSLDAHASTEGRVDVSIGADLIAAGYDRTFRELDVPDAVNLSEVAPDTGSFDLLGPVREPGYELHEHDRSVTIRPGVRIDLGGIAKGWAADRIRSRLEPHASCLVNLGGDVSIHVAEGDAAWPIGVDLVERTQSYDLAWGGLATSGLDRRHWRSATDGTLAHHVIDPRTGRPATTDIVRITVIGPSCVDAEIWAKALFIERRAAAVAEANRRGIASVIIGKDGTCDLTGALA